MLPGSERSSLPAARTPYSLPWCFPTKDKPLPRSDTNSMGCLAGASDLTRTLGISWSGSKTTSSHTRYVQCLARPWEPDVWACLFGALLGVLGCWAGMGQITSSPAMSSVSPLAANDECFRLNSTSVLMRHATLACLRPSTETESRMPSSTTERHIG